MEASLRADDGFTLIELLLTMVILSVGLLALAGLQVTSVRSNAMAKRQTAAVALAEAKLEAIKDTPYANVQSESAATVTVGSLTFTRQVTVTANSPVANTKTVQVTVSWTQGTTSRSVPVSTILYQSS